MIDIRSAINTFNDCVVSDKAIFLRLDLNVPIKNNIILDDTRILESLETINYLIKNNAKVIIATHLGRPRQNIPSTFLSTKIIAEYLNRILRCNVSFIGESIGTAVQREIVNLKPGNILMLENIRFHSEEELCEINFAKDLSTLIDIYVNEAFSCSHRMHASIIGIPMFVPYSVAGFRFIKEVNYLNNILTNQFGFKVSILGGAKISTKIDVIKNLIDISDVIFLGGGMVNTFLSAQGFKIGSSLCEVSLHDKAIEILNLAEQKKCKIILPSKFVVAKSLEDHNPQVKDIGQIENDDIIFDVFSSEIISKLEDHILNANYVLWNGPVGMFEDEKYQQGSLAIINLLEKAKKTKKDIQIIAGGGDSISLINGSKKQKVFDFISTAGGAFMEYISGKVLPGLLILQKSKRDP